MSGNRIDKRDFDAHRPLLARDRDNADAESQISTLSAENAHFTSGSDGGRSDGLLHEVVEGIVERDRRKMRREVVRTISFVWGVITWYDRFFWFCFEVLITRNYSSNHQRNSAVWVLEASPRSHFTALFCSPDCITRKTGSMAWLSRPRSPCTFPLLSLDTSATGILHPR